MPPRLKVTREDIIAAALDIVRKNGENALNARSIASQLGCSTQPIFSNFDSMEELETTVIDAAYEQYWLFLEDEAKSEKYPKYKALGMAYIRFAREERELFKLLFMRDRTGEVISPSADFEEAVRMMMNANGMTKDKATLMHLEMWTCVHGIGVMFATSFLSLDWDVISNILTDVYMGIRARHLQEENKHGCNNH